MAFAAAHGLARHHGVVSFENNHSVEQRAGILSRGARDNRALINSKAERLGGTMAAGTGPRQQNQVVFSLDQSFAS